MTTKSLSLFFVLLCCWILPSSAEAASKPFPQHTPYVSGSILPNHVSRTQLDADVLSYYQSWKARYVRTVSDTNPTQKYVFYNREGYSSPSNAVSCSEGHGYGMLATVIMADADPDAHTDFNALYYFYKAHTSSNNPALMSWQQLSSNGKIVDNTADGDDSATDGDLDIALSLLMAHRTWSSNGSINYKAEAEKILAAIMSSEVHPSEWILKLGDWVSSSDSTYGKGTRSSDFMLGHLKTFARLDTARSTSWQKVHDKTVSIVNWQFTNGGSKNTGLMPDFFKKSSSGSYTPTKGVYLESSHDGDYSWNACRTPWRLAMSYLLEGDGSVKSTLDRFNTWIVSKTGGTPSKVKAGYYVANGTNGNAYASYNELAFTAPLAVSAMMSPSQQGWLNALWKHMVSTPIDQGEYFGNTLKLHAMIVASGNWWLP